MTVSSHNQDQLKSAVSVKDMAAMCGLSRQRFAQLVKAGVFPPPLYDVTTRRPFYPEDMQQVCLEVRRRNFGINGKAVLFYARRAGAAPTTQKSAKTPKDDSNSEVLDGVKALGLTTVTAPQIAEALKALFPKGTASTDQAEVVRAVFIHLRRKNAAVNVASK
jgi:hypothetical protein